LINDSQSILWFPKSYLDLYKILVVDSSAFCALAEVFVFLFGVEAGDLVTKAEVYNA